MKYDTIEYILKELFLKYSVPIVIFDKKHKIIYPKNFEEDRGDLDIELLDHYNPNKVSLIRTSEKIYSVFNVQVEQIDCIALLGPQYIFEVDIENYKSKQNTNKSILKYKDNTQTNFIKLTKYIYALLNDKVPPQEVIIEKLSSDGINLFEQTFQENFQNRSKADLENESTELERRLIQAIISNNKKEFEWIFGKIHTVYFIRLHSDRLTSLKYKYIALVTIFTRVSINNGVNIKKAYSLSDTLIQSLEAIHSIQDCVVYLKHSCIQFMELINRSKIIEKSELVGKIEEYINVHVEEQITIKKLSNFFNVSSGYLSSEFKKYMGLTIHTYILDKKIEDAKRLLVETDLEIYEIAQRLSFSDQSHLNRVFKKKEKLTPKEYRIKYLSTRI